MKAWKVPNVGSAPDSIAESDTVDVNLELIRVLDICIGRIDTDSDVNCEDRAIGVGRIDTGSDVDCERATGVGKIGRIDTDSDVSCEGRAIGVGRIDTGSDVDSEERATGVASDETGVSDKIAVCRLVGGVTAGNAEPDCEVDSSWDSS